ncbi:MAG: hypothetical protein GYA62_04150, partial [Bacteroidales bacterium]|nr:hypothetical protein [Bacteroidales bacterium]
NAWTVKVLDSMAFTQMGLDKSLKAFEIESVKYEKPAGLGDKYLKTKEFEEYAKQDVKALYKLCEKIIDFHKAFDISISVSIAQFSMKVFRHNYLRQGDVIKYPPKQCVGMSERSYHGGLNYYKYDRPKYFKNLIEYDINSSYPYACKFLPSMLVGNFTKVNKLDKRNHGVYLVDGYIESDIPIIFNDEYKRIDGHFENICLTDWDIKAGIEYADKFEFTIKEGWVYLDQSDYNPFSHFIDDIYKKRCEAKNKPMKIIYKFILNSFYGKFIQTNEEEHFDFLSLEDSRAKKIKTSFKMLPEEERANLHFYIDKAINEFVLKEKTFSAGFYYNPFIATLITSNARYRIIGILKKYKGVHCATDSIKTEVEIPESELGTKLGQLKKEVEGKCFIYRNKFYLHYAKDYSKCNHKSDEVMDKIGNQHLCKVAVHGYKGSLDNIIKNKYNLIKKPNMTYEYTKVIKIREGIKQKLPIADFIKKREILNLVKKGDKNE